MRILQVVSGLGWTGGMQEYVSGLSRGLTDLGHDVVILSGGRPPPDGPEPHVLAEGLDIRWHPKRRVAARYVYPSGLGRSLRESRRWADVVHVHQPFFVGTWLAVPSTVPLAATLYLHPEHVAGQRSRRRRQLSLLLRRLDLVVGVSRAELDLIGTVRPPRRSGVVWPALAERPRADRPSARSRPLVLYVGRLSRTKGLDTVLRAFACLGPDVEVAVVGGGPEAAVFKQLCADVGLDPVGVLKGSLPDGDVEDLLARADVFVSASSQESFGIAPLRAIAHGCRPVLTDIPSHREIVTTLGLATACLVKVHVDPEELASSIRSALRSPPPDADVRNRIPTWTDSASAAADLYAEIAR